MRNTVLATVMTTAILATMGGCSSAPTTSVSTQAAPAAAMRHVMAAPTSEEFAQVMASIPKSISLKDADRLLIKIDESRVMAPQGAASTAEQQLVKELPQAKVDLVRGLGVGRMGLGLGHGLGVGRFGFGRSFAFHHFGAFNRFRFFRHGAFNIPYGLYNNAYVPFGYGGYGYGGCGVPYLYGGLGYGGYGGYGLGYGGYGYTPFCAPLIVTPYDLACMYPYAFTNWYGHPFAAGLGLGLGLGRGWRPWL